MSAPRVREVRADRLITAVGDGGGMLVACLVATTLVLAWLVTYAAGGSHTVAPHLFYAPVLIAASRWRALGTLAVAVTAGVVAGPLMPLDVEAGSAQSVGNWMARLVAFVGAGQLTVVLQSRSFPAAQAKLELLRSRARLDAALGRGEFVAHLQPLVRLATDEVVGVEALARWEHPEEGLLAPWAFIEEAEACGAIRDLDLAILGQACEWLVEQRGGPLADGRPFRISANVSAATLADADVASRVAEILDETAVERGDVVLEITETALVDDLDLAVEQLGQLRELGVRLAVDDFGVGQSSLSALHRYPVQEVKIDRSFVVAMDADPRGEAFMAAIVGLARALGIDDIVVEGIERAEQARTVSDLGCHLGQGYLYARPMARRDLEIGAASA